MNTEMQRRNFLQYAIGVVGAGLLGGCGSRMQTQYRKDDGLHVLSGGAPKNWSPQQQQPAVLQRNEIKNFKQNIPAISRRSWSTSDPILGRLKPMGQISKITIHHEGNPKANWQTNTNAIASTLRKIQASHKVRMKAGDIGYHYIIDRTGRVWHGRSVQYQGAHTAKNNSQNVGVMCLGNFDIQQPTYEQLVSLESLCGTLMRMHHVKASNLYCHKDLRNTLCPGKHLYAQFEKIKPRLRYI